MLYDSPNNTSIQLVFGDIMSNTRYALYALAHTSNKSHVYIGVTVDTTYLKPSTLTR